MGDAVIRHNILVALLINEQPGRVLTAIPYAVAVTSHTPINLVVHDRIVRATVQPNPHATQKLKGAIGDRALVSFGQHRATLPTCGFHIPQFEAVALLDIDCGPTIKPLILVVLVEAHPISGALFVQGALQTWLPVVAPITVQKHEARTAIYSDTDLISPHSEVLQNDLFSLYNDSRSLPLVRLNRDGCSENLGILEVHRDVLATDRERGVVALTPAVVLPRLNGAALGDDAIAGERNRI